MPQSMVQGGRFLLAYISTRVTSCDCASPILHSRSFLGAYFHCCFKSGAKTPREIKAQGSERRLFARTIVARCPSPASSARSASFALALPSCSHLYTHSSDHHHRYHYHYIVTFSNQYHQSQQRLSINPKRRS